MKTFKIIFSLFVGVLALSFLAFLMKGNVNRYGRLIYQAPNNSETVLEGPFESSGSTSRYALTKSVVEYGSVLFKIEDARFASPDVAGTKGKYFSLFMPGVSFAGVPFYFLGKQYGIPQLATYFSTVIFAVVNCYLISKISRRIGAGFIASYVSGLMFLFATNALSYALGLTQHHLSTTIILALILNAFQKRNFVNNTYFGLLVGFGFWVDIPNVFIVLPVGLYVLYKHFTLYVLKDSTKLKIKIIFVAIVLGLLPTILALGAYNKATLGSPFAIAQMVGRTKFDPVSGEEIPDDDIDLSVVKPADQNEERYIPFNSRLQVNGLYVLLFSDERGILYFAPVSLLGVIGFYFVYKNSKLKKYALLLSSVVLMNLTIYAMFGDVYGGWSFGPRYMIPALAVLAVGIGVSLTKLKRNIFYLAFFTGILIYSVYINVVGASTTTQVPPKVEALMLASPIPYTYKYNFDLINENKASSLLYNKYFAGRYSANQFVTVYSAIVIGSIGGMVLFSYKEKGKINEEE